MSRRREEFSEWGEFALDQLRGPVLTGFRRKLAAWRDPRARLIRRRRRAKYGTASGATATGALGGGAYLSYAAENFWVTLEPATETMLDVTSFGVGGLALAAGAGTVGAALKYRRLKRTPLPQPPPEPVQLPPRDSQAREPMRRLRDAEQSLHSALTRLTDAGVGVAGEPATEARTTAARAASALRAVADRLVAVEGAVPHAPAQDREALRSDVARLRAELDEGVESYGGLVAAAGRAVAASGASEQKHVMQDATDRLAGLAAALQELSEVAPGNGATPTEMPTGPAGQLRGQAEPPEQPAGPADPTGTGEPGENVRPRREGGRSGYGDPA
ncbi:hypothetical protein DFQ14_107178 [Halopolyspora algeriensis]|uniref:Uncharacterized protein n=1 Tax=Halopolyspora algeriensis TaxID=1500506 RepID=A0A368VP41_9ACTN|nr:hypothetical protein [Halopolyspora algeriensis]RCW43288.1 hypothetical protein DFQ14_107178 [Halopolyspora algeriensis]TQM56347.1 hypothetical protein FHU43_1141 [Halopolyspora algeriensis]